jgi:hypothetical protein
MVTLDKIVKSVLIQRGYSVHWYFQVLKFASDCLRELGFDVLGTVSSKKISVDANGAIDQPCDFLDLVRVGIPTRTTLEQYNRLHNDGLAWEYSGYGGMWEFKYTPNFVYVPDRMQFQFSGVALGGFIILDYMTDGSDINNATKVHPYAQSCIEAYVFWQLKKTNRSFAAGEANNEKSFFDRQYAILRGRRNPMTLDTIRTMLKSIDRTTDAGWLTGRSGGSMISKALENDPLTNRKPGGSDGAAGPAGAAGAAGATGPQGPAGAGVAVTEQTHTVGSTVTITSALGDINLLVNPAALLPTLAVTLPSVPVNNQRVDIIFGGTIGSGTVVTLVSILPNIGQTLLQYSIPSLVEAGEMLSYEYQASLTKWVRI